MQISFLKIWSHLRNQLALEKVSIGYPRWLLDAGGKLKAPWRLKESQPDAVLCRECLKRQRDARSRSGHELAFEKFSAEYPRWLLDEGDKVNTPCRLRRVCQMRGYVENVSSDSEMLGARVELARHCWQGILSP